MKKILLSSVLLPVIAAFFLLNGCKKKEEDKPATPTTPTYTCASCTTAPEAKAANDNTSKGIYKGIIIGSSGTIKFDLANNDTTIKAYMTIDGTEVTLTATVKWVSGASYVSDFTGTMGGSPVTITFSVNPDGTNPTVTASNIPGHPNATLEIAKETSTGLLKCYEGTYTNATKGTSGTFNLVLSTSLKKWQARSREDGQTEAGKVTGTFDSDKFTFDPSTGITGSSTLSGDNIVDGTWKTDKENGTWTGHRTL